MRTFANCFHSDRDRLLNSATQWQFQVSPCTLTHRRALWSGQRPSPLLCQSTSDNHIQPVQISLFAVDNTIFLVWWNPPFKSNRHAAWTNSANCWGHSFVKPLNQAASLWEKNLNCQSFGNGTDCQFCNCGSVTARNHTFFPSCLTAMCSGSLGRISFKLIRHKWEHKEGRLYDACTYSVHCTRRLNFACGSELRIHHCQNLRHKGQAPTKAKHIPRLLSD